jgi:hypothetical protein
MVASIPHCCARTKRWLRSRRRRVPPSPLSGPSPFVRRPSAPPYPFDVGRQLLGVLGGLLGEQ